MGGFTRLQAEPSDCCGRCHCEGAVVGCSVDIRFVFEPVKPEGLITGLLAVLGELERVVCSNAEAARGKNQSAAERIWKVETLRPPMPKGPVLDGILHISGLI